MLKVTFESDVGIYDARLSRSQAINWLKSRGLQGFVKPGTGSTATLESLDDDQLARALASAALELVRDLASKDLVLNVRNDPDDDEAPSWVAVSAGAIHAVKVRVVGGDSEDDVEPLPWSEDAIEFFRDVQEGLDSENDD